MKVLTRWLSARSAVRADDTAPALPLDLSAQYLADDPHRMYRWLRKNMPVAPVAGGGYLLTRHADVMAAFTDDRLGNAPSRFSVLHPRRGDRYLAAAMAARMPPFLDMPAHRVPRQALVRAFHNRFATAPAVLDRIAAEVMASLPRNTPFDLIREAAQPFVCRSIAHFVGLNCSGGQVKHATQAFFQLFAPITDPAAFAAGQSVLAEMRRVLAEALAQRRTQPCSDLLSQLLAFQTSVPDLTDDHIIDGAFLILADGVENIEAGIAIALKQILGHPETAKALISGHLSSDLAVAEALRLNSPAQIVARVARSAFTLHGTQIAADLPVFLCLGSAARDPVVFTDADSFAPGRDASAGLVFGLGRHRCIGEKLALAQIATLVRALLRAGATTTPEALRHHPRFGHRWPVAMQITLTQRAE